MLLCSAVRVKMLVLVILHGRQLIEFRGAILPPFGAQRQVPAAVAAVRQGRRPQLRVISGSASQETSIDSPVS